MIKRLRGVKRKFRIREEVPDDFTDQFKSKSRTTVVTPADLVCRPRPPNAAGVPDGIYKRDSAAEHPRGKVASKMTTSSC